MTTASSSNLHIEDSESSTSLARSLKRKPSSIQNTTARIKQLSQELKRLASISKQSSQPRARLDRTRSAAAVALKGLKFISKTDECDQGWSVIEQRFKKITASTDGSLPRSRFGECIGMNKESEEFAGELFDALARKHVIEGNSINKAQLKEFWEQLIDQNFDSRLRTFFDMVDKDADGRITEEEVREVISHSASANKLMNIQEQSEEYAALIMEELDSDKDGFIMIEDLEMLLLQGPNQSMREHSLSRMLTQKFKPTGRYYTPIGKWCESSKYFFEENWKRIWVLAVWVGVMVAVFTIKFEEYRRKAAYQVMGYCVCAAKGAAETLKFNMALILLPVCRNTLTFLRNNTKLGVVIPFDDNLNFHQVIAVGIAVGVAIHAISHLACDFPRLIHASADKYELMAPFFGDQQPSNYWHFIKSVEGVTGIVMVALMAVAFTLAAPWFRQSNRHLPKHLKKLTGFNAFWYSHHLLFAVYALLIVHGIQLYLTKTWYKKTTWMYLAIPLTLYLCERLTRALRSKDESVIIQKVGLYSGVLALHMSKPKGFSYKSGQYMFVNCAAVSPFEWHPFSITSAPDDDYLSVHIRIVGDWTKKLETVFSKACHPPPGGTTTELPGTDCLKGNDITKYPKVLIDGPYGAPAQDYKNYEVVLLIGLGIGATPMISIVKDIANNIKAMDMEEEENCDVESSGKGKAGHGPTTTTTNAFKTKRAYFYWVTRDPGSFEWFKEVMNEVAEMDHKGVIELHNYCTCVYEEGDARSALITMLQSLNLAKNGVDVISGTRVKSHFAKPKWPKVYHQIARNHNHGQVGVFYCGPPVAIKELHQLASDLSHSTSTKFEFHKENF